MKKSYRFLPWLILLISAKNAAAFCGFYVAKAGAELFNNKSEVILVRDGNRTVITMSNDFKGNVREFAMVVPVPTVLKKEQIRISDASIFSTLDAYSAPRLVEYYDENPCYQYKRYMEAKSVMVTEDEVATDNAPIVLEKHKVTIEAQYQVGEYDILILSALESDGLKLWLIENGYSIPQKAEKVLDPYIKSNMKFFVVKVNLAMKEKMGFDNLRPLQIEFNSEKFMLPLRLGMANSTGSQDMIVYAFTRTGRIEAVNYRTLNMPTARQVPLFTKERFDQFYFDLFKRQYLREGKNAVFLEYAWNVTPTWGGMKCDPCIGPPPIMVDFAKAGVDWVGSGGAPVFFTRLHVRYAQAEFPEDLVFQVTPNMEHFQARYILTHPATGTLDCSEGKKYLEQLQFRRQRELQELASLTGWDVSRYSRYVKTGSSWINEQPEEKEDRNALPIIGLPQHPNLPKIMFFSVFAMLLSILLMVQKRKSTPKISGS